MINRAKIHFPNLDALRFFAFLSVFISHIAVFLSFTPVWFQPIKKLFLIHGDLGVNFFFVLSGFLISYLLFTERTESGEVSLKGFYKRRILRIWPLYFIVLIIGIFIIGNTIVLPYFSIPNINLLSPISNYY